MTRSCLRCLGIAALTTLVLGVVFVGVAARWLAAPALPAERADAMYVLGGDSGDRVLLATELYKKGMAPAIVLTGIEGDAPETRTSYLSWRGLYLAGHGIPAEAVLLDDQSTDSRAEAAAARKMADAKGWKRILVVSDPPHLRRLHLVWSRAFAGSPVEIRLVATRPRWWNESGWWHDAKSAQFVLMEYIKLVHNAFR